MVLLADLLPCAALQKISMALITRSFHLLWEDSDLLGMLATRCLICQEQVDLHHIQAHLVVRHQITADKLKYVTHQLSAVYKKTVVTGAMICYHHTWILRMSCVWIPMHILRSAP